MDTKLDYIFRLSPNQSGKRKYPISRITPHCVVAQATAARIGDIFADPRKKASCNYGIGTDGDIVICVPEENRSWCSSSSDNDNKAVTIECASDNYAPYAFNEKVYSTLIELSVDICRRNGFNKLLWIPDAEEALSYNQGNGECLITVHRWFANKACPGGWLMERMPEYAAEVTRKLAENNNPEPTGYNTNKLSKVCVGCFHHGQDKGLREAIYNMGYNPMEVPIQGMHTYQIGAFATQENVDKLCRELSSRGFPVFINNG